MALGEPYEARRAPDSRTVISSAACGRMPAMSERRGSDKLAKLLEYVGPDGRFFSSLLLRTCQSNEVGVPQNDGRIEDIVKQRRRGGQPGNRNAWKHGTRSGVAIVRLKLTVARLKALAHIARRHGILVGNERFRVRAVRRDQIGLLREYDPEMAMRLSM